MIAFTLVAFLFIGLLASLIGFFAEKAVHE